MLKLYSTTSSIFRRNNIKNQNTYRNITTATTGFISHTKTSSFDNTHTCNSKIKLSNTSRNTYNSNDVISTKQLSLNSNKKKINSSYNTSQDKITTNNYEMKKLKMKVYRFINLKKSNLCRHCEYKNNDLNDKFKEYFKSEKYIKKYINYHHNCHFNKSKFIHHKYTITKDSKHEKENTKQIKKEFQSTFTEKEQRALLLDPAYYIPNKQVNINLDVFKYNKLSDKINTEEKYTKQQLKETKSKSYKQRKNRKRFMTLEYKQILDEIAQLKDFQLNDIKHGIEYNRAKSRQNIMFSLNQNKLQHHRRNKSVGERKGKNMQLHIEVDHLIQKAVNKDHDERIHNYFKTCREKDEIEKELVSCCSKVMSLRKKKYSVIPIVKEDNLTDVCKKDYCLMLNKQQLNKIERFIEMEKNEEGVKHRKQQENQFINYYVTKVKEQYGKKH